jgi:hypothetical protein
MRIKPLVVISLVAVALLATACSDPKSARSKPLDRAKPVEPILTSTVPTAAPEPIDAQIAEPSTQEKQKAADVGEKVFDELPAQEPDAFEPQLESHDGLSIQRLVTAPDVEHREPVAASSVFGHHDEKVVAFVELSNGSEEDKSVLVHFIGPEGRVSGGIELRVPAQSPRWRTWAYTRNAKKPGLWRVEIRSLDGTLLGALPFEVEPGC